jgi:hypothetical protein
LADITLALLGCLLSFAFYLYNLHHIYEHHINE